MPRESNTLGFGPADYAALVTEGSYHLARKINMMNEKVLGVVRHVLTAVGAVVVYVGWTDDATWVTVMGSIMTMVPFVWSWVSKPEDA